MGWAAAKGVLQRQATGWVVVVVGSSRSGGGGRRGGLAAPVHTRRAWTARESGTTWYAERRKRRAGGGSPVLFAVETNARFGSAAAVTRAVTSFACGWWLEHRSTGAEEEAGARGLWARQAARERYVLEKAATWDQAGERAAAISVGGVRLGSRSELPDQPTGTMSRTKQNQRRIATTTAALRGRKRPAPGTLSSAEGERRRLVGGPAVCVALEATTTGAPARRRPSVTSVDTVFARAGIAVEGQLHRGSSGLRGGDRGRSLALPPLHLRFP